MDLLDIKEFFLDTIKYLILAIVIVVIILFVVTVQQVVGPSMNPTLKNQDLVVLNKISLTFQDIKRNNIISFYYADTKYLIKRVVGLPGEHIEYKNNKLYIDNVEHTEPYLDGFNTITKDFKLEDLGYSYIPRNMYLVLGDNREDSLDSRDFGLIKKEDIIGKVSLRFWPLNKLGFVK